VTGGRRKRDFLLAGFEGDYRCAAHFCRGAVPRFTTSSKCITIVKFSNIFRHFCPDLSFNQCFALSAFSMGFTPAEAPDDWEGFSAPRTRFPSNPAWGPHGVVPAMSIERFFRLSHKSNGAGCHPADDTTCLATVPGVAGYSEGRGKEWAHLNPRICLFPD
jgi:hypothetical protein